MNLYRVTLDGCHAANGLVVVVDVLRAFTTAATAFARKAEEILLVSSVEEAFELRAHLWRRGLVARVVETKIRHAPTIWPVFSMELRSRSMKLSGVCGTHELR